MWLTLGRILGTGAICLASACAPAAPMPMRTPTTTPTPAPIATPAPMPNGPPNDEPPPGEPAPGKSAPGEKGETAPIVRIMPLGDSITFGVGSNDRGGYRSDLEERLTAAGVRFDFVGSRDAGPAGADDDNEGHSGWTIARMARRIDRWLATYRPDVVLLHIGTNDVRREGSAEGAVKRLGVLLNRIRRDRPAAQIFVAQIVGSRAPDLQRRIDRYNAGVARMVAARHDPRLHLVDQGDVRAPLLHPNDAGYAAMAAIWFTAIEKAGPAPARW